MVLQTANATVTSKQRKHDMQRHQEVSILGTFFGLVFAVAVTAAVEALDTRVRSAAEIEEILGVPQSAARLTPPPADLDGRLLMLAKPRGTEAEAFRVRQEPT